MTPSDVRNLIVEVLPDQSGIRDATEIIGEEGTLGVECSDGSTFFVTVTEP